MASNLIQEALLDRNSEPSSLKGWIKTPIFSWSKNGGRTDNQYNPNDFFRKQINNTGTDIKDSSLDVSDQTFNRTFVR